MGEKNGGQSVAAAATGEPAARRLCTCVCVCVANVVSSSERGAHTSKQTQTDRRAVVAHTNTSSRRLTGLHVAKIAPLSLILTCQFVSVSCVRVDFFAPPFALSLSLFICLSVLSAD